MNSEKVYDCLIIGGGPAGISGAIYMARYLRSVLVIDEGKGRWNSFEINQNYFGFPKGVPVRKLVNLGRLQANNFGAKFTNEKVESIESLEEKKFRINTEKTHYLGKTIIFATGVVDIYPEFDNREEYIGRSLFWCITCDGYKTIGKRVVIIGNDDDAAGTCMQFLNYTRNLAVITNKKREENKMTDIWFSRIKQAKIPIYEEKIANVYGKKGMMEIVELEDGERISTDFMFNQQGAKPNSRELQKLGVTTDENGYIYINENQKTNIPFIYAAGDVTKQYSHQVVTAVFEGATAAESANYDLYLPSQRFD